MLFECRGKKYKIFKYQMVGHQMYFSRHLNALKTLIGQLNAQQIAVFHR